MGKTRYRGHLHCLHLQHRRRTLARPHLPLACRSASEQATVRRAPMLRAHPAPTGKGDVWSFQRHGRPAGRPWRWKLQTSPHMGFVPVSCEA